MANRTCSLLCLLVVVACGCLQPASPPVPPVSETALSGVIQNALLEERRANSALANQVALTPAEADQKTLWLQKHAENAQKAGDSIATALKAELDAAKTPDEISSVWKEVADGYRP